MNPNLSLGHDRMQPGLLPLLAAADFSLETGVTGLSTLTRLVGRLARTDMPNAALPFVCAVAPVLV